MIQQQKQLCLKRGMCYQICRSQCNDICIETCSMIQFFSSPLFYSVFLCQSSFDGKKKKKERKKETENKIPETNRYHDFLDSKCVNFRSGSAVLLYHFFFNQSGPVLVDCIYLSQRIGFGLRFNSCVSRPSSARVSSR